MKTQIGPERNKGAQRKKSVQSKIESPTIGTKMFFLLWLMFPDVLKDVFLHMCPHLRRYSRVPTGELLKVILCHGTLTNTSYQHPDFSFQSEVVPFLASAVSSVRAQSPGAAGSCSGRLSLYFGMCH